MRARSALASKAAIGDLCAFAATLSLGCAGWGAGLSAVSGTVRNAITGLPIGHALVRLIPANPDRPGYLATTGPDGAFHLENIQPADYQVLVERSGFTRDPETVRLLPDNETQLKLDATPLAAISGTALDADDEPVPNAGVRVISARWLHGRRAYFQSASADANERGEFRVAGLQPGRYRLAAIPPQGNPSGFSISEGPGTAESRLAPVYYPSGMDLDGAAAVDLVPGEELTGIQLKLSMAPAFHLRGSAGAGWKSWLHFPFIQATRLDNGVEADWFEFTGGIKGDGAFDIAGLPPGVYTIAAGAPFVAVQSATVTVTSHDINGVVVSKPVTASVRVRVLYPPDTADKPGDLTFRLDPAQPSGRGAGFRPSPQTRRGPDGSLVFEGGGAGNLSTGPQFRRGLVCAIDDLQRPANYKLRYGSCARFRRRVRSRPGKDRRKRRRQGAGCRQILGRRRRHGRRSRK